MRINYLYVLSLITVVAAVYPNVEVDPSADGSDVVVIQDIEVTEKDMETESEVASAVKQMQDSLDEPVGGSVGDGEEGEKKKMSPFHSFLLSISMIIVSEIGDKTFLVAAIMAMRYPRKLVFSAAFSALALMTVLSGVMGHVLPTLLSHRVTQFCASILFFVFGAKLLKEGLETSKDQGVQGEMSEVEEEIQANEINARANRAEGGISIDLDSQRETRYKRPASLKEQARKILVEVERVMHYAFTPAWIQTFLMTFLGEWGDRSQIATIALAAGSDYVMVILGGVIGHGLCTGGAVLGGQYLASKISVRTVLLGGSVAFFVFAITYLYSAYYDID